MKYKNTKTGAIIDTVAILGGVWVSVEDAPTPKKSEKIEPTKKESTKRNK